MTDAALALRGLEDVVRGLRAVRGEAGVEARGSRLPSRDALTAILDDLRAAIFAEHFAPPGLADGEVDVYVAGLLGRALTALDEEVRQELGLQGGDAPSGRAAELVAAFAAALPDVRRLLDTDVAAAVAGDPAASGPAEVVACYPGLLAIHHHRLAHVLHGLGLPLVARLVAEIAHGATGIDLHPGAQIGSAFFIDHGTGVVVGETAVLGDRVRLYQGVTLGAKRFPVGPDGALLKGLRRHPILEDDVVVYAGATVLGRIVVGRGSTIGGSVWLTWSVPQGSRITQAQARSDSFEDGAGI